MPVHRRQLPLAYQCEGFVPAEGSAGDGGFCERCQQQVHDVSAMREPELRRLLAKHAGGTVCLAYRVDDRGRVRLRPEPAWAQWQPLAVGALALLLAACAGLAGEPVIPGGYCLDADGYEVPCVEWVEPAMQSVPEQEVIAAREPVAAGCPVRPTAPIPAPEPTGGLEPAPPATAPPSVPSAPELAPAAADAAAGAEPSSARYRANFSVDPDQELMRGIVVVVGRFDSSEPEPHFVPTTELWEQWRERRAERKREQLRWREDRRARASR